MSAGSQPRFAAVRRVAAGSHRSADDDTAPWQPGPTDDPYLVWAEYTRWRGFETLRHRRAVEADPGAARADEPRLRLLLVLKGEPGALAVQLTALRGVAGVHIPPMYDTPVGDRVAEHFVTATLPKQALGPFMRMAGRLGGTVTLATPLRDQGPTWPGDGKARAGRQARLGGPDLRPLFADVAAADPGEDVVTTGAIGVFDYGCPFLRTEWDTGRNGASRIAALWHQEPEPAALPWKEPRLTGYGRVLAGQAIRDIQDRLRDGEVEVTEARAYASLRYLIDLDDPRRRVHLATHGAHVLHVAAGTPDPLSREYPVAADDHAAQAAVLFVQLPEATAGDSSGASLGAFLLDGLRYMMAITAPRQPLVVNVSYGGTAGPHDGSSLIERAMDQLLESRPTMQIVIAAGNARHLGLHARRVATKASTALFRIDVAPGDRTDTFIEFWYPKTGVRPEFRLRLPDGDWSGWVGPDSEVLLNDIVGEPMAAFLHRREVPDGAPSMGLLAICPTEAPDDDDGPLAPAGLWEVEVRLPDGAKQADAVDVRAWIKRDDARPFSGRVQSCFVGLEPEDTEDTLSSLSCGRLPIVVSGFRWSDGLVADYASTGPRRAPQWPLVHGLCERDSIDPGIRAAAVRSGETLVMNGTSVAAPVVARQVFNLLMAEPTLDREGLKTALRELARRPGSRIRIDGDPPGR